MLIGIYANAERDIGLAFTKRLKRELESEKIDCVIHDSVCRNIENACSFGNACDPKPDIIVSLGGDGTILSAIAFAAPAGIPVMGINLGRMGFLTSMTADDNAVKSVVHILLSGDFTVSERSMLCVRLDNKNYYALNEIVFYKQSLGKTVDVSVKVGRSHVAKYKADGFIVSTPTGSTGWALSAGGPIISPDINCLLLLPMNCHQLSARPVIACDSEPVTVTGGEAGSVIADGKIIKDGVESIVIVKSEFTAKLVTLNDFGFYERLTQKLGLAK